MPIWFFPALLALSAIVSLGSGLWLLLHMPDVARVFGGRREGELMSGRAKARASRSAVWIGLILFNAGWIACVLLWIFVISGGANAVVQSPAA